MQLDTWKRDREKNVFKTVLNYVQFYRRQDSMIGQFSMTVRKIYDDKEETIEK